jgi:hypothetical protein
MHPIRISSFTGGTVFVVAVAISGSAAETAADLQPADFQWQTWNWHVQNTDILQATPGLAGVINAVSSVHREFLAAGGTGILAGDGALNHGTERDLETYYDFRVSDHVRVALDCQFVANPAYNRDRGPVSIFAFRLHWIL